MSLTETNLREQLINEVKKYECIYNFNHKEHKNIAYKKLLWDSIGETLNIKGSKAKEMWRVLRDGYSRWRKGKMLSSSGRKYYNYRWSKQMEFLDESLDAKAAALDAMQQELERSPTPTKSLPETTNSNEDQQSTFVTTEVYMKTTPSSSPLRQSPELAPAMCLTPEYFPAIQFTNSFTENQCQPPTSSSRTKRKKQGSCFKEGRAEKTMDYPRTKKMREYDSVDFLFSSYAETFRKLSHRKQIEMKLNLAKIFADAELSDYVEMEVPQGGPELEVPIKEEYDC
ncbi:hypothetical protein evm_006950 [Chilo suppressalis]|nr:hypothetical protein evm_006950 [Chilo suppressalis]